jgi:hypothetical protein
MRAFMGKVLPTHLSREANFPKPPAKSWPVSFVHPVGTCGEHRQGELNELTAFGIAGVDGSPGKENWQVSVDHAG